MYSFYYKETMIQNWVPLTLQGGGMLHLSMGAILGITSYTKGTTQTAMVNNGVYAAPDANTASTSTPTASVDTDTPSDTVKRPIPRIKT